MPRLSASPYGGRAVESDAALRDGQARRLPANEPGFVELEGVLTASDIVARPAELDVGVACDDVTIAGETLEVEITTDPGVVVDVVVTDDAGGTQQRSIAEDRGDGAVPRQPRRAGARRPPRAGVGARRGRRGHHAGGGAAAGGARVVNDIVLLGRGAHRRPRTAVPPARRRVRPRRARSRPCSTESATAPAGFGHARRVRTGGLITPGLIDLHNHLAYNTLPLWIGRDQRLQHALPVAGRADLRARRVEPGPGARHRRAGGRAALRRGEGGRRRRHRDPGLAARDARLPGMDGAQHREGGADGATKPIFQSVLPASAEQLDDDGRPAGRTAARSSTTSARARRRRCARSSTPCATHGCVRRRPDRHPLDGARRRRLRATGQRARRWRDRLVAVLQPLALRRHDRRARPRALPGCASASARTGRRRARATCSAS